MKARTKPARTAGAKKVARDADILLALAESLDPARVIEEYGIHDDDLRAVIMKGAALLARETDRENAPGPFILNSDGASRGNPGPAGAGFAIYKGGRLVEAQAQYLGEQTNNQAEYNALILGLERALNLGATEVVARADSELMVRQLNGEYKVKNAALKGLYNRAIELIGRLDSFKAEHVPREGNTEADALANRAIDEFAD